MHVKNILSKRRGFLRISALVIVLAPIVLYVGFPALMALSAIAPDGSNAGEPPEGFALVTLTTADDVQLGAWYAEPQNGMAIILVHGAGGGRDHVRAFASMLHDNGFGVLAVNMRGYGDSEGRINRLGWDGTRDIGAAVRFLTERDEANAIGGLGLSMGGEILLGAASHYPELQAIVTDGATSRGFNDYISLPMNQPFYRNFTHRIFCFMVGLFSGGSEPETTLVASIKAAETTSFLFIAAGNDDDEALFNELFHTAAGDRGSLWVIPGVGHTGGFSHDPAAYEQRVIDFFQHKTVRMTDVL